MSGRTAGGTETAPLAAPPAAALARSSATDLLLYHERPGGANRVVTRAGLAGGCSARLGRSRATAAPGDGGHDDGRSAAAGRGAASALAAADRGARGLRARRPGLARRTGGERGGGARAARSLG